MAAETLGEQVVGQPVGPLGDLATGETAIAEHQRLGLGTRRGDGFQHRREIDRRAAGQGRIVRHAGERYGTDVAHANPRLLEGASSVPVHD